METNDGGQRSPLLSRLGDLLSKSTDWFDSHNNGNKRFVPVNNPIITSFLSSRSRKKRFSRSRTGRQSIKASPLSSSSSSPFLLLNGPLSRSLLTTGFDYWEAFRSLLSYVPPECRWMMDAPVYVTTTTTTTVCPAFISGVVEIYHVQTTRKKLNKIKTSPRPFVSFGTRNFEYINRWMTGDYNGRQEQFVVRLSPVVRQRAGCPPPCPQTSLQSHTCCLTDAACRKTTFFFSFIAGLEMKRPTCLT